MLTIHDERRRKKSQSTGQKKRRARLVFLALGLLLLFSALLGLSAGSIRLPISQILRALLTGGNPQATLPGFLENLLPKNPEAFAMTATILFDLRLPRVLAAILLGGGLAVSGVLLQTFFANPIAGPFVLGISSGAKLFVALALVAFAAAGSVPGSAVLILAAFAGSVLVLLLVLLLAGRVRNLSLLVICGIMVGYICSAITDFVTTFADDASLVNLHGWSLGSFSGIRLLHILPMACLVLPCVLFSFLLAKPMRAYLLGENYARSVGVRIRAFRILLVLISSALSAAVTAFAGPISFVGVAVPHVVRRLFASSDPALVLPGAFLGGGIFCLLSDLLARTLFAPAELSVSSITALFGVPVVLTILLHKNSSSRM